MGFRFQRRITILPGVRINLSKSGASMSLGPRGASLTVGKRGTYANLGLPGTGLSYRTRLDSARSAGRAADDLTSESPFRDGAEAPSEDAPAETRRPHGHVEDLTAREPADEYEATVRQYVREEGLDHEAEVMFRAVTVLLARERGEPLWKRWAAAEIPDADEDDPDAFEARARLVALQRFARRMEADEPDFGAWSEVLLTDLSNEQLPYEVGFDFAIEADSTRIHLAVELPEDTLFVRASGLTRQRALYLDACCGLLLRLSYEVYRVLPQADDLVVTGYRAAHDPATGAPVREVLLKCATDRQSFRALDLDNVDPSRAFEHLGGVWKLRRGEMTPLGYEPLADDPPGPQA